MGDEPTNHLDIPSKEVLEEALRTFEGAVVLASHDRYFLRQVANRIVEVRDQRLVDYKGDYNVFLQENDEEAEAEEVRVGEKKRKDQKKIKAKSKMSKAEKTRLKKEKAKAFQAKKKGGKTKNWADGRERACAPQAPAAGPRPAPLPPRIQSFFLIHRLV